MTTATIDFAASGKRAREDVLFLSEKKPRVSGGDHADNKKENTTPSFLGAYAKRDVDNTADRGVEPDQQDVTKTPSVVPAFLQALQDSSSK